MPTLSPIRKGPRCGADRNWRRGAGALSARAETVL